MADARRRIITDSLGVGIGVGTYGITFGALATSSGLTVVQTCVLSLLAFTGASQFAFIGVIASGGAPFTAALTATLLGARNMFYSISLANILQVKGWRKLPVAHIVIDESTAMALAQDEPEAARTAFAWTGVSIFIMWNATTLIGALAGNAIGDPKTFGLDAAVGAAFLGLLWPRLNTRLAQVVALAAVLTAATLVPLTAPGVPIIVGGGAAVVLGLVLNRCLGEEKGTS